MKKVFSILLSAGLVFGLLFAIAGVSEAKAKVITFKNCTAMHKVYKGGIARAANVKNKGGKTHYKPYVSSALYYANKKSDRDHDGIACER